MNQGQNGPFILLTDISCTLDGGGLEREKESNGTNVMRTFFVACGELWYHSWMLRELTLDEKSARHPICLYEPHSLSLGLLSAREREHIKDFPI